MKPTSISCLIAGMIASSTFCLAQQQSLPRYDQIVEKRSDLRVAYQKQLHDATANSTDASVQARPAASAVDRSHRIDFANKLPKRADLRVRVSAIGMEAAYAEWLKGGRH